MARGGFISSELCVSKMADLVGSRAKAQRILADALLNGSLSARGRPPREILPCPPGQLRDLGSGLGDDVGPPKPVENVPAGFWKSVNGNDIVKWNWRNGWFVCLGYPGKNELYDDVRFNEAELNALLDKRRESIGGEGPRARKKRGEVRALFTAGVGFLARQGTLTETVHSCIGERDWPKLARRLVATAQNIVIARSSLTARGCPKMWARRRQPATSSE